MDPQNPSRDTQATDEWFASISSPNLPPPELHQKPSKKKHVLIALAIVIAVSAITGGVVLFTRSTGSRCLTTQDYQVLTGETFEDVAAFSPRDSFYTTSIVFMNDSNEYIYVGEEDPSLPVRLISDFYAKLKDQKPMIITVSAGYTTNDSKGAAQQRIDLIVNTLTASGVDESSIVVEQPEAINAGSELQEDSEELTTARAYISITSPENCSE